GERDVGRARSVRHPLAHAAALLQLSLHRLWQRQAGIFDPDQSQPPARPSGPPLPSGIPADAAGLSRGRPEIRRSEASRDRARHRLAPGPTLGRPAMRLRPIVAAITMPIAALALLWAWPSPAPAQGNDKLRNPNISVQYVIPRKPADPEDGMFDE